MLVGVFYRISYFQGLRFHPGVFNTLKILGRVSHAVWLGIVIDHFSRCRLQALVQLIYQQLLESGLNVNNGGFNRLR